MNHNSVEILLVEDNLVDAELATRELMKHNLSITMFHVKNGREALDFIFATGKYEGVRDVAFPPKLILLDIQMPKLNGLEVLREIKTNPRTRSMVVVMLTSSKESPDIQSCYDLGANSYIVKPVNVESFSDTIKNLGFYWLLINQPRT
jgi:two-component system, response regulator